MPAAAMPKPAATGKTLDAWLRRQIVGIRMPLAAAVGAGTIDGLLLVSQAWLLALTINAVAIPGQATGNISHWLFALLGVFAARALTSIVAKMSAFEAAARIRQELRMRLYAHLDALGTAWPSVHQTGDLTHLLVDGVEALEKYYAQYLPQIALAAFIPLTILVIVFPVDWISGLIMLITAPLIPFFMVLIGRGAEQLNQRQWRQLARMSAHFFDVIEGLTTLKLFNASRREASVVARISDAYRQTTFSILRVALLSSLMLEFLATVSIAMVAVYIGFRLYYGEMHFLPGLFVLLLAPEFYKPLRNMGAHYHARMEAIGASEGIVALLNARAPKARTINTTLTDNRVLTLTFQQVGFAYEIGHPALEDVSLTLASGHHIALVGRSGSGKTTLSHLLLGFIEPTSGRITVNDIDLKELSLHDWHQQVAWLPQRPTLFHGTVLDNIRLGMPEASLATIREAAEQACADEFIRRLPQGYDTLVGDRGQGLSGGEIQRIALARVFLKDAPVVVLDEASASVDPETGALITQSIGHLARKRAVLVIAHRLETVRQAEHILVMERGRIVEHGSHDALIARAGHYAHMLELFRGVGA